MDSSQLPSMEWELVRRARGGDQGAFHQLVDAHAPNLYALAVRLLGNATDAEDVLQETLTGAFVGLQGFAHRSAVRTWLTRILMRQVGSFCRQQRRGRLKLPQAPAAKWSAPARSDLKIDLCQALLTLSLEHREVIVLRELQGLSYQEIAAVLEVPEGTVESRLFRARRELQGLLKEYMR